MSTLAELHEADLAGVVWRTSSYTANNSNCVEVARVPAAAGVAVRDSKDRHASPARVTRSAWGAFLSAVVHGSLAP